MKRKRILLIAALPAMLLLFNSCNDGSGGKPFPVNEENAKQHIISLEQADSYIRDFAQGKEELGNMLEDSSYLDRRFNMPVAEMFNKDAISLLLGQEGAEGVRIYLGRDEAGQVRLVLLPVDAKGNDIRKMLITDLKQAASTRAAPQEGQAIEVGQRCPTLCDGFNQ